jgi:tetratricopeptide (TPR) repeat protein
MTEKLTSIFFHSAGHCLPIILALTLSQHLLLLQPALAQSSRDIQLNQVRMNLMLLDAKINSAPSADAYFMRGSANAALGKNEAAEADFAMAEGLKYSSDLFKFYETRGSNFLVLKKNDAAVAQLTKALALKPGDTTCLINRASGYFELARYKEALSDAQQAAKQEPNSSAAQQLVGTCHLKTGQYEKALPYLNQAVALEPRNFEALHYRGLTYEKLGKKAEAKKDFDDAVARGYAPGKTFEEIN